MAKLSFDGRNEEPVGFEVYPAGTYVAEVLSFERGTSSTGKPQMKVGFALKTEPFEGKPYTDWVSLTEAAAWRVKGLFWACGAQLPKVDLDMEGELFMRMCNQLKGHELALDLEVNINPNNGKENNKVARYMRTEDAWDLDVNQLEDDIPDFLRNKE